MSEKEFWPMSKEEFDRLSLGRLEVGDYVWSADPGEGLIGGTIIGECVLGRATPHPTWRVRGPRGEDFFIEKGHAIAAGFPGGMLG